MEIECGDVAKENWGPSPTAAAKVASTTVVDGVELAWVTKSRREQFIFDLISFDL